VNIRGGKNSWQRRLRPFRGKNALRKSDGGHNKKVGVSKSQTRIDEDTIGGGESIFGKHPETVALGTVRLGKNPSEAW